MKTESSVHNKFTKTFTSIVQSTPENVNYAQ